MKAAVCPAMTELQALYVAHGHWLHGWLRRRLGCSDDASDLTHDTFIRLFARPDLATIREPRAFLTTIAHGVLVNHLRRRDLERAYLDAIARMPPAQVPCPESQAIVFEALLEIDRMLDGLPAKVRRAFLLAQLDGWSYAAIAAELHVSVSSVKQYMVRATTQCLVVQR